MNGNNDINLQSYQIEPYVLIDEVSDNETYIGTSKSFSDKSKPKMFLVKSWYKHHQKLIEAYRRRWNYAKLIVATYLSFANGQDLFNEINHLIYSYTELGVLGRSYGDGSDGLMDFIESSGNFIDRGMREKEYDVYQNNWDLFINELKNVLVLGIYEYND